MPGIAITVSSIQTPWPQTRITLTQPYTVLTTQPHQFTGHVDLAVKAVAEQVRLVWILGWMRLQFYSRNCKIIMINYTVSCNFKPDSRKPIININNDILTINGLFRDDAYDSEAAAATFV